MTPTSEHAAGNSWHYESDPPNGMRVGISFSGGGIRSATFCLGVYQRLAKEHIFARARYLSAVSGGSYLAAGLATSYAKAPPGTSSNGDAPWARGSLEEARLRQNLSYLAPGGAGRVWLGANLLYGLILNLAPLLLGAFVCGRLTGALLRALYPGLGKPGGTSLAAVPYVVIAIGLCVLGAVVAVGYTRFHDKQRSRLGRGARVSSQRLVTWLLGAAAGAALALLALPLLVDVMSRANLLDADFRNSAVHRFLLGVGGVACSLLLGAVAVWLLRRRRLRRLRGSLAAIAGLSILLVPFILATETGTVRTWELEDFAVVAAALAVILAFAVLAHNRRYSMHLFYRERIQEAFTSYRESGNGSGPGVTLREIPHDDPLLLTDIVRRNKERAAAGEQPFPELVICAAVAAHDSEVPSKSWAAGFAFDGECSGNPRLNLQLPTKELEAGDWIGGGGLTLTSMMAISGAALSPMMGRLTLPAFRFLMAMLNIRLGVWVRNPARDALDVSLPPKSQPLRRTWRYVVRGWREPGAWYVLKEALGLANAGGRYVYVSDGGHWENLGLTELLRRRCTHIVAVDASGSPGLGDVGRAIAIARAELGVDVHLDPRCTSPGDDGLAASPVASGTFTYPDGEEGKIDFARCVLWKDAPVDLHLFAEHERRFPNHPTSNQFLSGDVFDAYRALGWAVGGRLAERMRLPPPSFDEPR